MTLSLIWLVASAVSLAAFNLVEVLIIRWLCKQVWAHRARIEVLEADLEGKGWEGLARPRDEKPEREGGKEP